MTKVNQYLKAYSGFAEGDLLRSRQDKRVSSIPALLSLSDKKLQLMSELYSHSSIFQPQVESYLLPIGSPVIFLSLDLVETNKNLNGTYDSNGIAGFVFTFLDVSKTRKGIMCLRPSNTLIEIFRKLS